MPSRLRIARRGLLGALGGALGVAAPGAAAGVDGGRRRLTLLDTHVAGTAYYEARRVRGNLRPGETLFLRREPGNPHDDLAIEVFTATGSKLGYVPRVTNEPFARLMDADQTVDACVIEVDPDRYDDIWISLTLEIA